MKRPWCYAIFLILPAVFSFAETAPVSLYIDGTAFSAEYRVFFMDSFKAEAAGLGYTVANSGADAEYTYWFEVELFGDEEFIIHISLISNKDNSFLVSFSKTFANLEETYEFIQYLFLQAVLVIPREILEPEPIVPTEPREPRETVVQTPRPMLVFENDNWRNKWLYARASVNYPVTFYRLKSDGLVGGIGIYEGPFDTPNRVSPLDNSIVAMPGATAGLEVQFLDWMSVEPNFQLSLGRPGFNLFPNYALGLELKFPLKFFRNFIIAPYAAVSLSLNKSPVYDEFPHFAFGGGGQIGMKGGESGAFFADINYMYSLGDAVMYNTYEPLYPEPEVIHYQRFVLGFGLGYKFGFIDRKKTN